MLTIKPITDTDLSSVIHWPCPLSEAFKCALLQQASIATVQTGQFVAGESGSLIHFLSGLMLMHWIPEDGRHSKGFIVGQGDWMGHSQLFAEKYVFMVRMEVVEPTTLVVLPRANAIKLAKEHGEIYKLAYHVGVERWQSLLQVSHFNPHGDCRHNVAFALLDACRRMPRIKGTLPVIRLSQQQIALLTGFGRQRVNAELQYLAGAGFIEIKRNSIALLDAEGLGGCLNAALMIMDDPRQSSRWPFRWPAADQ